MASKPYEKFSQTPWFWVIAGPNGVGKSTWASSPACSEIMGDIPILNPDSFPSLSLITAGKQIFHQLNKLKVKRENFAVETTLSGNHYFRFAEELKQDQWHIGAIFIGVEGDDVCISRVEERKLRGGHDVPQKDIIRRYKRSLSHINQLLRLADHTIVLDNSQGPEHPYQHLLESINGEIIVQRELPKWLRMELEDFHLGLLRDLVNYSSLYREEVESDGFIKLPKEAPVPAVKGLIDGKADLQKSIIRNITPEALQHLQNKGHITYKEKDGQITVKILDVRIIVWERRQ